jgi:hypothetical protein
MATQILWVNGVPMNAHSLHISESTTSTTRVEAEVRTELSWHDISQLYDTERMISSPIHIFTCNRCITVIPSNIHVHVHHNDSDELSILDYEIECSNLSREV